MRLPLARSTWSQYVARVIATFPHQIRPLPHRSFTLCSLSFRSRTSPRPMRPGFQALKGINLEIRRGEIFALLGPNGAGKTTLISIICGIVNPTDGAGHGRRPRHHRATTAPRARMIGLVPQELTTDAFETRVGDGDASAAACSASRPIPPIIEKVLKDLSLWDKKDSQDHDALRRHEAPRADRQGAVARAADPVPRRADRRRRRRAAQGHVGGRARAARVRRHHHPDHALHRGGRGDGRPHRRHQQGRDHPGRGQGRADAQARQEAADAAAAGAARRRSRRARRTSADACRPTAASSIYTYDTQGERTGITGAARRPATQAGIRFKDLAHDAKLAGGHLRRVW